MLARKAWFPLILPFVLFLFLPDGAFDVDEVGNKSRRKPKYEMVFRSFVLQTYAVEYDVSQLVFS